MLGASPRVVGILGPAARAIPAVFGTSTVVALGMFGFDLLALGISLFSMDHPLVQWNGKLHKNGLYNAFQFTVTAVAAFSGGFRKGMAGWQPAEGGIKPGTLSDVDARKWYLEQEAKIPDLIDDSLPLEQQARQAFELRNQYRMQARELMSNRQLAERLKVTDPNLTWEQIVQKQMNKGLSGDDVYRAIIESSQRSRTSVNQSLGLE